MKKKIEYSEEKTVVLSKDYICEMNAKGFTVFYKNGNWYESDGVKTIKLVEKPFDRRKAFEYLEKTFGKKCAKCESAKHLILSRKNPRFAGELQTYSNWHILCRICEFDEHLNQTD